jgi:signal transduction histidine kinase
VTVRSAPYLASVRARATAAATLVIAVACTVAALLMLHTLEAALSRGQDVTARSRARDLAVLVTAGPLPRLLTSTGEDGFIQVVNGSGRVLSSTPNVAGRAPAFAFGAPSDEPIARTVRDVRDDQDLENYRVVAISARSPSGRVTVYVANSVEVVSEAATLLRVMLLVGVPAAVVLIGSVTWVIVGRALRPVESIRAQVADISQADLARRVPVPAGRDEIAELARTMNDMLDRLEAASARQRTFVADASHELQSPLTRFRMQLEVALARHDGADWPELAASLLSDSTDMERLVRDLLFLSRADDGIAGEPPYELVDLDDIVLEEAARARVGASATIDTSTVSAAPVSGNSEQLRRLLRNLLENAVRYAATRVQVSLVSGDDGVVLAVRDDGPGVPAVDQPRVFDRFVRLDDARSRDTGGTGLGLAIVAAIAHRHRGSVTIEHEGTGATFVLRLPPPLPSDDTHRNGAERKAEAGLRRPR